MHATVNFDNMKQKKKEKENKRWHINVFIVVFLLK